MIKNMAEFMERNKKVSVTIQAIATAMVLLSSAKSFGYEMDNELANALSDRPVIENFAGGGTIKAIELGEEGLSAKLHERFSDFADSLPAYQADRVMPGLSDFYEAETVGLEDQLCFVVHKQIAPASSEGFYEFNVSATPLAYPKHLTDFFIKSHETSHCASFYEIQGDTPYDINLYTSLREVAADLGATIDYMRVTGDADLYQDFIRPLRMAGVNTPTHRTAWALDAILENIDPAAMSNIEAKDIPAVVDLLIKKHIIAEDGKTIDMDKPVASILDSEVRAAMV